MGNPAEAQATDQRLFSNGLPKIESMLKAALDHHPEVQAARSKLRAAEAELRQSELAALKEVMDLRARWEAANKKAAANANREHLGDLAALEWELAFLLGTRGDLGSKTADESDGTPRLPATTVPLAPAVVTDVLPRGDQAAAIRKKLSKEMPFEFVETPLVDVGTFLSEASGLRFIIDKQALENDGLPADLPITLKFDNVELGSALQALEDLHEPLYFVIRDYGILVTTESKRSSNSVSVRDFRKLTDEELREKLRQQRLEERSYGGMGGMGGGGMGGGFF